MRIVFFKTGKPKQFDYKPRYWDEEKERQEDIKKRTISFENPTRESISREIDMRWRRADRKNRSKAKGINLLVYLVIVLLLLYFIFKV